MDFQVLTGTFSNAMAGLNARVLLNNGVLMPWLGLGAYGIRDETEVARVIHQALALGYRSIDTAKIYQNESEVGAALRTCGLRRKELFITTKVWNDDMRAGRIEAALAESLKRLQLDYVDLYLLHWPIKGKLVSSWRALEKLHRSGLVRAIGVSNYLIPHLEELLRDAEIVPAVNQIEFHPYLQSKSLIAYCHGKGIRPEAWSPLMQGRSILQDPVLTGIARKHNRTPAQVILRWNVQGGVVTIPKSANHQRLEENGRIFNFALSTDEMHALAALDRNERIGADPMNFDF
jgi:diketogulonate reductase-like aldo/keto reductase